MTYEEALCILEKDSDNPELKELDPNFWNLVWEAKGIIGQSSQYLFHRQSDLLKTRQQPSHDNAAISEKGLVSTKQ